MSTLPGDPSTYHVVVPGSKSLTIRALAAASLAEGTSRLVGALEAADTQAARQSLRAVGAVIDDAPVGEWAVEGVGGRPRPSVRPLDAGESALTARIMIAIAALIEGRTVIDGRGRLPLRPMQGMLDAVASIGATVEQSEFPLAVRGIGRIAGGKIPVDAGASSQFVTALLLVAPFADHPVTIEMRGRSGSGGYLGLTLDVVRAFGGLVGITPSGFQVTPKTLTGTTFTVEPDASSAVYPMVAAAITGKRVTVENLGAASRQPDMAVCRALAAMGCKVDMGESSVTVQGPPSRLLPIDTDASAWPDGSLGLAVACLLADGPSRIRGLGSLRHKESDRLAALVAELAKLGASAAADGDELTIRPGELRAATVDARGDHRMAMSFGILKLIEPAVGIDHPEVVSKTWPGFWSMLDRLSLDPDVTPDT